MSENNDIPIINVDNNDTPVVNENNNVVGENNNNERPIVNENNNNGTSEENSVNNNNVIEKKKSCSEVDIPKEYLCPLTKEIMREPMVMPDGYTYEKEAIKKILQEIKCSPMTKMEMDPEDGIINFTLKSLIEKFIENNNLELPNLDEKINNLKYDDLSIEKVEYKESKVEFEELSARFIAKDKSAGLCEDSIHIYMKPKKVETTLPVCLLFVVDISGSMDSNCCQNIKDLEKVHISRLELIKHSLKTIISSLRKDDMISVIVFSNNAEMKIKPVVLHSKDVKDKVIKKIDDLCTKGATNIYDGIKMAIDTSRTIPYKAYQKSIMMFTDGQSNIDPPKGIYATLKETLETCDDQFTISTFSYGNDVEAELLVDIADLGNGIYGYIPDATMVGTIFINYMANLLSTITPVIKININEGDKKSKIIGPLYREVYRNMVYKMKNKESLDKIKIIVELPMTNQTFEVPINTETADLKKYIDEMAEIEKEQQKEEKKDDDKKDDDEKKGKDNDDDNNDDDDDELLDKQSNDGDDKDDMLLRLEDIDTDAILIEKDIEPIRYEELLLNQISRVNFIKTIENILKNSSDSKKLLDKYLKSLNELKYKTDFIKGLIIDIDDPDPNHGQVGKAISSEYYNEWGKKYLSSYVQFHEFEQCGNFKDESLQFYAHDIFTTYRKMANTLFVNLPPPKATQIHSLPMRAQYTSSNYRSAPNSRSGGRNRSSFFGSVFRSILRMPKASRSRDHANRGAPMMESCVANASAPIAFNYNVQIQMNAFLNRHGGCFNGEAVVVLANGQSKCVKDLQKGDRLNNNAVVECVIEQKVSTYPKPYMCDLKGVLFTPYHPVSVDNIWYFPVDLTPAKPTPITSWFNLILKDDTHQRYEVEFQNGIKAITLGHYRTENEILKHPYFGTDAVLKDLQERDTNGYANGYIFINEIQPRQWQYDENQYCINYYKVESMTTVGPKEEKMIKETHQQQELIY